MERSYATIPSLMKKYRKLVTYFANTQLGRDLLGIPYKEKISLLIPNGYHLVDKKDYQGHFFCGNEIEKKLYKPLLFLDRIYHPFADMKEMMNFLLIFLGEKSTGALYLPKRFYNTAWNQTIFNPTATAVDGVAGQESVDVTFSTIRSAAGNAASTQPSAKDIAYFQSSNTSNQWAFMDRTFALFDTSSMGGNAVVTAGSNTMGFFVTAHSDPFSPAQTLYMIATNPASSSALANSDYTNVNYTNQATGQLTIGSLTNSAYNNWTLNGTGEGNIKVSGITKFGAVDSADFNNSAPTWQAGVNTRSTSNYSGNASNKPQLTVNFTIVSSLDGYSYWM